MWQPSPKIFVSLFKPIYHISVIFYLIYFLQLKFWNNWQPLAFCFVLFRCTNTYILCRIFGKFWDICGYFMISHRMPYLSWSIFNKNPCCSKTWICYMLRIYRTLIIEGTVSGSSRREKNTEFNSNYVARSTLVHTKEPGEKRSGFSNITICSHL